MISVIVPIYNVANYLEKCLDSLSAQTIPDVEFILIDDGSTDQSGVIADRYQDDSRFRIFHTANRGLSAARNYGIKKAHGEWLMFVDSDDWVEAEFCEAPLRAALRFDADLVIFQACFEKNGKTAKIKNTYPAEIIDSVKAIEDGKVVVWNKLYRQELFRIIRFPEGQVFEDVATTHKLVLQAQRIVMLPNVLYHKVYRKDSIFFTFTVNNKKDAFVSALQRAEDLKAYGCEKDLYEPGLVSCAIIYLVISIPGEDPLNNKAGEIVDAVRWIPSYFSWKKKVLLMIWKTNKPLFHLIRRSLHRFGVFQP